MTSQGPDSPSQVGTLQHNTLSAVTGGPIIHPAGKRCVFSPGMLLYTKSCSWRWPQGWEPLSPETETSRLGTTQPWDSDLKVAHFAGWQSWGAHILGRENNLPHACIFKGWGTPSLENLNCKLLRDEGAIESVSLGSRRTRIISDLFYCILGNRERVVVSAGLLKG